MLLIAAIALLAQGAAYQGELKERLAEPVRATFDSPKPSYDLEVCVADTLTVLGTPTVFRDGPDNIVIAASALVGNVYLAAVTVMKTPSGSHLELRLRGKGFDDRLKQRITNCL